MLIKFQNLHLSVLELIMTYVPNDKLMEYDPALIERFCFFKNPLAEFGFPKIDGEDLHAILVNERTTFIANKFGIEEPVAGVPINPGEIEMAFVPLLAFDERFFWVGYGKGFYDKFLSKANDTIQKIACSFFGAEKKIEDINEFDMALDICITPFKTYHFN